MKKFTADFETATWLDDETYVWAWAVCSINEKFEIEIGNNIDNFMKWCYDHRGSEVFFHNEKFDGEFIISWLLNNGFTHITEKKDIKNNTFTTLISDLGQFYSITVYYKVLTKRYEKITFIDSLKILPFSVDVIAQSFGLEISKLKLDYNKPRSRYHVLTEEEKAYIKNDVLIVAKALKTLFDDNLTKMTQGSNALYNYKEIIGMKKFNHQFPLLEPIVDEQIRKSYKGGFTYLAPEFAEKDLGTGTVLDVNSLYPSVMQYEKLCYGQPIYFEGKYEEDCIYDLYIQNITCAFELKENKIPTIQLKNSTYFLKNEYLTTTEHSNGVFEIVDLTLTSVDLKLFLEHYNVYHLEYWRWLEI